MLALAQSTNKDGNGNGNGSEVSLPPAPASCGVLEPFIAGGEGDINAAVDESSDEDIEAFTHRANAAATKENGQSDEVDFKDPSIEENDFSEQKILGLISRRLKVN